MGGGGGSAQKYVSYLGGGGVYSRWYFRYDRKQPSISFQTCLTKPLPLKCRRKGQITFRCCCEESQRNQTKKTIVQTFVDQESYGFWNFTLVLLGTNSSVRQSVQFIIISAPDGCRKIPQIRNRFLKISLFSLLAPFFLPTVYRGA